MGAQTPDLQNDFIARLNGQTFSSDLPAGSLWHHACKSADYVDHFLFLNIILTRIYSS
jgi:hypothetical protein